MKKYQQPTTELIELELRHVITGSLYRNNEPIVDMTNATETGTGIFEADSRQGVGIWDEEN